MGLFSSCGVWFFEWKMCMPTPNNVSGFGGYSWFTSSADLTKGEVDAPSSLSYTLGSNVSVLAASIHF